MRSERCHHVGDSATPDPIQAMENRITNIKAFQLAMPPRKVTIDQATLATWTALLTQFDTLLASAEKTLLEIKKDLYQ